MIGAIAGDIIGSVYEFRNYRAKDFSPLFHPRAHFTDDTVCTIAIADALLSGKPPAASLREWGRRYWDNGGWGMRFAEWLCDDDAGPYGSWGNGAAMRISPAAFLADSLEQARRDAVHVTEVTHDHPEGIKGALATTDAIWMAFEGAEPDAIRRHVAVAYGYDMERSVDAIRPVYKYNETCQQTVPEAIICALEAIDFEDAIRNAISIGGDSDTLACIAGGIAEARFGVPQEIEEEVMRRLTDDFRNLVNEMYRPGGTIALATSSRVT